MVITRMVTTLIAMIVSTALFAGETGCKGNYAAVFHPEGMKVVKGWDGNSAPQVFKCYAEVALSGDLMGVIYANETITGFDDKLYAVELALVSTSGAHPKVVQSVDLTDRIPVHAEQTGNFYRMNAIGEVVKGSEGVPILHINVWAEISGSGAISGSSDLFYALQQNKILPILDILDSNLFAKENIANSSLKISEIFFSSAKTATHIYVQTQKISFVNGEIKKNKPSLTTFELRGKKFEPVKFDGQIPAGTIKLKRVTEVSDYKIEPGAN